jgi:lysophospholipase L1-like esterase
VGDSITAGYGNLGTAPCPYSVNTQSAYASYGMVISRMLNAEASVVAVTGWGLIRDINGNTANVLPKVYANTLGLSASPAWTFARKADAVIINLGTNDSNLGDPGTAFETGYVAFLKTVRSDNPNAWTSSPSAR